MPSASNFTGAGADRNPPTVVSGDTDFSSRPMSDTLVSKTPVLVVEDNVDTQILLRYFLQANYHVHITSKVDEALTASTEHIYALVLVDIHLGEERTGIDLLHLLRQTSQYTATPIIALTAYAMPGDKNRFIDIGFDGYISKPFTQKLLLDTINHALTS